MIRAISARKNEPEWLLAWRLKAYEHWLDMEQPDWAHLNIDPIDFQAISYFSAPKSDKDRPQSLDEVDPKLLETYDKLGVPLHERPGWQVWLWTQFLIRYQSVRLSRRS